MARYESLRDRLPLLYRPDADDAVDPVLPLGRDDIVELGGDAGPIRFTATPRGEGSLIVTVTGPGPVRRLALTPGRAPGSGFALEIHAVEGGGALSLAADRRARGERQRRGGRGHAAGRPSRSSSSSAACSASSCSRSPACSSG